MELLPDYPYQVTVMTPLSHPRPRPYIVRSCLVDTVIWRIIIGIGLGFGLRGVARRYRGPGSLWE
jgi:hypothetical protein